MALQILQKKPTQFNLISMHQPWLKSFFFIFHETNCVEQIFVEKKNKLPKYHFSNLRIAYNEYSQT